MRTKDREVMTKKERKKRKELRAKRSRALK